MKSRRFFEVGYFLKSNKGGWNVEDPEFIGVVCNGNKKAGSIGPCFDQNSQNAVV
jgi:hypothetical protein